MDISCPHDKAKFKSSSTGLVNGLDCKHGEILDIKDFHQQNTFVGDAVNPVEGFEDLKLDDSKPVQKSLCKYATFPTDTKMLPSDTYSNKQDDEEEELEMALRRMFSDESVHSVYSHSISLPTPLRLVSAMKGSRERQVASPRKLSVKWAPDVYDPPPTIVSHTVNRGKKQKSKEERNNKQKKGKRGRKGNSSHGSSKDKKQFRKVSGSTDRCYKAKDAHDRRVELPGGLNDFDVASPESYCGSSFLKKSLTTVHYSVAEAL